jgi:hypothetical protein
VATIGPACRSGHGAELVDREQDLPVLAAGRGVAGQDVDDRAGLRLGHADLGGALEDAVPGVGVAEAAGARKSAALAGGPPGASTASATTASITSA